MKVSHEQRSAVLEIITKFVIEGRHIIFVTKDLQSARIWCEYFSRSMKQIGIVSRRDEKMGLVKYERRKIIYDFPLPVPVPNPRTNPIRWLTHHFRRIFGLLDYKYRNSTMRFVFESGRIEDLYGYHGQIYFDDEEVEEKNTKFWRMIRMMDTDEIN